MLPAFLSSSTQNNRPTRDDRRVFVTSDGTSYPTTTPPCTTKELKDWGKNNIRLSDDPSMSAKVNLHDLSLNQRLVFRNITVRDVEVSTLLDCAVLNLLPARFSLPPTPMEAAVEFRQTQDKGMGAFATQDIAVGALLLVEIPTIVVQNTVVLNFGMTSAEVYRELFRRVPEKTFPALLALANSQPPGIYDLEEGILRSNTLGIALPAPVVLAPLAMGHSGLFLKASRLNHSCSPNVIHRFNSKSFALTVHAVRPIAKGEEIVHSYINQESTATRDERRSLLRDRYHFDCVCDHCTDTISFHGSDVRRQRIRSMTREEIALPLETWFRNNGQGDLQKVIAFHLVAVEDIRIEALHHLPSYFLHISLLATCFAALEDIRNFRMWAGKARDVFLCNLAPDGACETFKFIQHPEAFSSWGLARKMQKC
ncbi:hypothetical protein K438DRAFT_1822486 [Mycena galopus ATCC 62051]|nr:hypothetical protein K438DRAFT_1822486 [Mycena galopus ATCC 62051]